MPSRVMTDPKFRNGQTATVELRSTCKCRGIRRSDTSRDVRTSHVRRRRGGAVKLQLILHYASRSGPLQCVLEPVAMGRRAGHAGRGGTCWDALSVMFIITNTGSCRPLNLGHGRRGDERQQRLRRRPPPAALSVMHPPTTDGRRGSL